MTSPLEPELIDLGGLTEIETFFNSPPGSNDPDDKEARAYYFGSIKDKIIDTIVVQ